MLFAKAIGWPLSHEGASSRLLYPLLPRRLQLRPNRLAQIVRARTYSRSLAERSARLRISKAILTGPKELVLLLLRFLHESSLLLIGTWAVVSPVGLLALQMRL
jgi:hypothetical protein